MVEATSVRKIKVKVDERGLFENWPANLETSGRFLEELQECETAEEFHDETWT